MNNPLSHIANWNAAEWTALAQTVTAIIALFAVVVGYFQLREAQRQRREQTQPFVVVDIEPSPSFNKALNLIVHNTGLTVAHDVRITFDPPLRSSMDGIDLEFSQLLNGMIPTLTPGRRIVALFDVSHERFETDLPSSFEVTVEYLDSRRRKLPPLRSRVDFGFLYDLRQIEELTIHDAAKALRDIDRTFNSWSNPSRKLEVHTRSQDRHDEQVRIEHAVTGSRPSWAKKPEQEIWLWLGRSVPLRPLVRRVHDFVESRKGDQAT